jgi:hypothetical protein
VGCGWEVVKFSFYGREEKGRERTEEKGEESGEIREKKNMCRHLFRLILAGSRGWRWMLFTVRGRRALRRRRRAMWRTMRRRRRPENKAKVEVEVSEPESKPEQEQEPEPKQGPEQQPEAEPLHWGLNWQLHEMPLPWDWEPGQVPVPYVPVVQVPWD